MSDRECNIDVLCYNDMQHGDPYQEPLVHMAPIGGPTAWELWPWRADMVEIKLVAVESS